MHDDIAIHIRNWIFSMKMHKCYSSLAYRRMNHVIYKHFIIHFSQIHVTQRLSGKTEYSSPNCWILNRAFGHLAAQNCQQWQHQENELPNHGAMPEGAGSFLLGSHHGHLQHDGRTIFLWCTAQLPQHGTGEGTTLQGIKNRKSIKAGICLAPEGAMSSHSTAAKAVSLFQLCTAALVPWSSPGHSSAVFMISPALAQRGLGALISFIISRIKWCRVCWSTSSDFPAVVGGNIDANDEQ